MGPDEIDTAAPPTNYRNDIANIQTEMAKLEAAGIDPATLSQEEQQLIETQGADAFIAARGGEAAAVDTEEAMADPRKAPPNPNMMRQQIQQRR